jgi:hypothetical protein
MTPDTWRPEVVVFTNGPPSVLLTGVPVELFSSINTGRVDKKKKKYTQKLIEKKENDTKQNIDLTLLCSQMDDPPQWIKRKNNRHKNLETKKDMTRNKK